MAAAYHAEKGIARRRSCGCWGVGLPELRISDAPAGVDGQRRVELTWADGADRRAAVAILAGEASGQDSELIRWYLEDYAEYPAEPAPKRAQRAETALATAGSGLFDQVFADRDAAVLWALARDQLAETRVVVDADPGQGPGLAWELLRDPGGDSPVALAAGEFVRVHPRAAGHSRLPEPSGDVLRVLLVISRPGREDDVPFRSVASRLVRGGAGEMDGLDLDVLRPATFARLSEVLRAANAAGRPYHVVHFDGHGDWLDLSELESAGSSGGGGGGSRHRYLAPAVGPVREGPHGYLLFEDPGSEGNTQFVDGPSLGRLLAATGVPVLVLNACRSAYAEARGGVESPDDPSPAVGDAGEEPLHNPSPATGDAGGEPVHNPSPATGGAGGEMHARVRAYGSLAAEIADAGVPGVIAMRYVVYVVTAAQFVADLYAHLLAGKSLGRAAGEARRALAANPVRQVGTEPVMLQDWVVPVVYEAAPLVLLSPERPGPPLVTLTQPGSPSPESGLGLGPDGLPRPPDAGFFGRDETLLALDRAFDTQQVVLLHAFAGAGKSSTAAELARWYAATGGLDLPGSPEWSGATLWSSFERHLTADQLIGQAGDAFAPMLEAIGIAWAAVTDPAQRRGIVLQVLAQLPVLWIWDNSEPVAGFPEGTTSDWTSEQQADLAGLLRDLAQRTRCKILLTSRRDEHGWLGDLPARVRLPRMPMREAIQLASALAAKHGTSLAATADWRPLLRYAAGNPLTITVLTGQALRENTTTSTQIQALVTRLQAGETSLEVDDDEALGRTRSLAASLSYGFTHAFTDTERAQLAVLHLFRDTADADALRLMGTPETAEDDAVPELAGLTRDSAIALLDRASGIGLLEPLGSGYYQIHPALPWYFTTQFTTAYGPPGSPAVHRATRSYATVIGQLGDYYWSEVNEGRATQVLGALQAEENNLRHALDLARTHTQWTAAVGCLQGLQTLYQRTGRDSEWARLVQAAAADFTDPATSGPLPGREGYWSIVTSYRVALAIEARDWPAATTLQDIVTAWDRDRAAEALAAPTDRLTPGQRHDLRALSVSLHDFARILRDQDDHGCLPRYQEALELAQRIGDRSGEASVAHNLGTAYLDVPGLRDLDQAEHWYQHSLALRDPADQYGRAACLDSLGRVALNRFDDARAIGQPGQVLLDHLNTALNGYRQALDLTPATDHQTRAATENQLGVIYRRAGDTRQALRHYQQSIQHEEARDNIYGAGQTRYNIALLLYRANRIAEALLYARAAVDNYLQAGAGAADRVTKAEQLIAYLEEHSQDDTS
jgi:tetratricopeptide (TPR) repeat protein